MAFFGSLSSSISIKSLLSSIFKMCMIDELVSCLSGQMCCKTFEPKTSPITAAHLSRSNPLTEDSWSDLTGLVRISLRNASKREQLILSDIPGAGTMVQSHLCWHLLNFELGSRMFPFYVKNPFYKG